MAAGYIATQDAIPVIFSRYGNIHDGETCQKLSSHTVVVEKTINPKISAIPYPMVQMSSTQDSRLTDLVNLTQIWCYKAESLGLGNQTSLALPSETLDIISSIENAKLNAKYNKNVINTNRIWNPNTRHKNNMVDFKKNNSPEFIEISPKKLGRDAKKPKKIHPNNFKRPQWQ